MEFTYEITPRPPELGGGFRLKCFENGIEEMGGVFEDENDAHAEALDWLDSHPEPDRQRQ